MINSFHGSLEKNLAQLGWVGGGLGLGLRIIFLKNIGIFRFATLPLEIPEQASFHHWKFSNIVYHPFEILR